MKLYSFKFHLVTVVGLFLALALGIFIGSTFTEESIILQQRGTIEGMRLDIVDLQEQRRELNTLVRSQQDAIALLEGWLGDLQEVYWQANPVAAQAVLIHDASFNPEFLGPFQSVDVVQVQIVLAEDFTLVDDLTNALVQGDGASLAGLEGIVMGGELAAPVNFVFLALDSQVPDMTIALAASCLDAELPVIALGNSSTMGLAELINHNLYYSVSHLDTPLGLYCLGAILQGQGGHYGLNNLLPPRGVER